MTQAEALDILKMGHNVFLTGPAGSGKTYVLNQYIKYLKDHEVDIGITASTGIAASHMGGMTIHAWTGLGVKDSLSPYDLEDLEAKQYLWKRFENAKVLIIDEISMLHHFRLDLIDQICRSFKRSNEPFGGMQIILCGDFFQLPPVARPGEPEACFAYHSPAWKKLNLKICYLEEQHRQSDDVYLEILNAIRQNRVTAEIRRHLESRFKQTADFRVEPTKLYSHNLNVDSENELELDNLRGQTFEYLMAGQGRDALVQVLKKSCLAPEVLRLKKGARVMFVKNNYEQGYVNGTLGIVERCTNQDIFVRTVSGKLIDVEPASWIIEEEGKKKAEITQYPLRLAWAITVHKSQGMSLDAALVDLSRSFEPGMGYVALSRVRSLSGLCLTGINDTALKVNDEVLEFDEQFAEESAQNAGELQQMSRRQIDELEQEYLERIAPKNSAKKSKPKKPDTVEETKRLLLENKTLLEILAERKLKIDTILDHCEKIKERHSNFDFSHLVQNMSESRQKKIWAALIKSGMEGGRYLLGPAKTILGNGFSYDEIRLVRLIV